MHACVCYAKFSVSSKPQSKQLSSHMCVCVTLKMLLEQIFFFLLSLTNSHFMVKIRDFLYWDCLMKRWMERARESKRNEKKIRKQQKRQPNITNCRKSTNGTKILLRFSYLISFLLRSLCLVVLNMVLGAIAGLSCVEQPQCWCFFSSLIRLFFLPIVFYLGRVVFDRNMHVHNFSNKWPNDDHTNPPHIQYAANTYGSRQFLFAPKMSSDTFAW